MDSIQTTVSIADNGQAERRQQTPMPADSMENSPENCHYASAFLSGFRLKDILCACEHTDDFKDTRSEYILVRLRFMALFFAMALPLWIPVDYVTLNPEHFADITVCRLLLAVSLLVLGLAIHLKKLSFWQIHAVLSGVIVLPTVFYMISIWILGESGGLAVPAGYVFMPYLIVSLLAVFPLTLIGSCTLIGVVFGVFVVAESFYNPLLTFEALNKFWLFMMFAGIVLWVQSGQLLMLLKLYRESTMDPLTGLMNRRGLMKRLAAEVELSEQKGRVFSVLMFDLDRFKRVNDQYGHLTGDLVLQEAASLLKKQVRAGDILARFGGEELIAVLPGITGKEAIFVAERVRVSYRLAEIQAPGGEMVELSTSVGVTEYEPGEPIAVTLSRVDDSLYKAKELGRNQVVYSQSTDAPGEAPGASSVK